MSNDLSTTTTTIITCSECRSSTGPFSKRQSKKGLTARCTPCITSILFQQQQQQEHDNDNNDACQKSDDDDDIAIEESMMARKRRKITPRFDDDDDDDHVDDDDVEKDIVEGRATTPTHIPNKARTLPVDLITTTSHHKENHHRPDNFDGWVEPSDHDDIVDTEKPAAAATTTSNRRAVVPATTTMMDRMMNSTTTQSTPTTTTSRTTRTLRDKSYDNEATTTAMVAINAIKRKIMRRDLATNEDDDDDGNDDDATKGRNYNLLQELSCVICHELLYDPISLPNCGHSFCAKCWAWWEAKSRTSTGVVSCPTCRTVAAPPNHHHHHHHPDDATTTELSAVTEEAVWKPTRALQVAIAALFPNETADRKLALTAGENDGRHQLGHAVILPIQEHDWRPVMVSSCDDNSDDDDDDDDTKRDGDSRRRRHLLKARRSIVLDDTDQRMVYGLAIHGDVTWEKKTGTVYLAICRVHMEQDEAEEGFPVHVTNDSDDECLIVPDDTTMIAIYDAHGPVARHPISSGCVELRDLMQMTTTQQVPVKCYSIRHESTGCELQIQAISGSLVVVAAGDSTTRNHHHHHHRRDNGRPGVVGSRSLVDEGHCSTDEDEEAEAAALEEEENEEDDDFLINEDVCQICDDGGELLVCDGGGRGGCARSFHVACIGRREVPAGDWICQDCAAEKNINTGKEGHEFPEDSDDDSNGGGGCEVYAEFSGDEDEDDEGDDQVDIANSRRRRVVLIDSDDESD